MNTPKDLIAAPDFVPYWAETQTEGEYHADKTAIGSGQLRTAMDSLKAFHGQMFLGKEKPVTDAMILGRKIHMAILEREKFNRLHVVQPEFMGYTKDGKPTKSLNSKDVQEQLARWQMDLPTGAVIVTNEELDMMIGIAESIMQHPNGPDTIKNTIPECSGYYRDPETNLRLKIKPDLLRKDGTVFVDLKSTKSSDHFDFGKQVFGDMRIDIQLFMYAKGIESIQGNFPKLIVLKAVEKLWPYEVGLYYYTRDDLGQAEADYHSTLRKIRRAIDEDHWPMRQERIQRGHTPSWFINQSVERSEL